MSVVISQFVSTLLASLDVFLVDHALPFSVVLWMFALVAGTVPEGSRSNYGVCKDVEALAPLTFEALPLSPI